MKCTYDLCCTGSRDMGVGRFGGENRERSRGWGALHRGYPEEPPNTRLVRRKNRQGIKPLKIMQTF